MSLLKILRGEDTQAPQQTNIPTDQTDASFKCENVNVIDLVNVTKKFKTDKGEFTLFDNLTFSIPDFADRGQFISILGPSGSGKSQLLKIFSGLEHPTSGDVLIYGKKQKPNDSIPMVFQQYSSFPWLNVIDNVALPLKLKGIPQKERYERAMEVMKAVGLEGQEYKWTSNLSGGQQQRVAIARCLAYSSQIILFDEASSALDIKIKREFQETLLNVFYNSKFDPTIISVTHNIPEAVYLSDRIYIMAANPCRIHSIIDIDFHGERRSPKWRQTTQYSDYVKLIETKMDSMV